MSSFWSKIARAIDRVLSDPPIGQSDLDGPIVEEAVRIIQSHVDADRQSRVVKRLRISDLSPERRAQLTAELAQLLKKAKKEDDQA